MNKPGAFFYLRTPSGAFLDAPTVRITDAFTANTVCDARPFVLEVGEDAHIQMTLDYVDRLIEELSNARREYLGENVWSNEPIPFLPVEKEPSHRETRIVAGFFPETIYHDGDHIWSWGYRALQGNDHAITRRFCHKCGLVWEYEGTEVL